jgi:hypothetical protein
MVALTQRLGRLTIRLLDEDVVVPGFPGGRLEVPFNPRELGIERSAQYAEVAIPGLDSQVLQWVRGEGDNLSLELFFDVTENMVEGVILDGNDVRRLYVAPLEQVLVQQPRLHAPPRVAVEWGPSMIVRRGVARSLSVTYDLFDGLGRPARGTARITIQQDTAATTQIAEAGLNSPDLSSYVVVREGDTLPAIAHREYRDATRWRAIARANRISDPLALAPGTELLVPKIL